MRTIGRFLRWLFIEPIREAIRYCTVILLLSYAVANWWIEYDRQHKSKSDREIAGP